MFRNRQYYGKKNFDNTPWMAMRQDPTLSDPTSRAGKYFRRRFRIPYPVFLWLLNIVKQEMWFDENHLSAPLELKLLAVFRRLGRGGTFDDSFDGSALHEDTVRIFFHEFCVKFSERFFEEFVKAPETEDEIRLAMAPYHVNGFPGAIGSVDCVHIRWDKCPFSQRSSCHGKEGFPTLAFECVVGHNKKIYSATKSHPGARNDKMIVKFDAHVQSVKSGKYGTVKYNLYGVDGNLNEQRGCYLVCDNGYHKWRMMQCPMKHTASVAAAKWSCHLESIRKDVECVFGILKHRFRILKFPVELHNQDEIDSVFFTCCILNNMLLQFDGYDKRWDFLDAEWEHRDPDEEYDSKFDGRMKLKKVGERALQRVQSTKAPDTLQAFIADTEPTEVDESFFDLRQKLIIHYQVASAKKEVHWLQ